MNNHKPKKRREEELKKYWGYFIKIKEKEG